MEFNSAFKGLKYDEKGIVSHLVIVGVTILIQTVITIISYILIKDYS
jgi:hypothetical protein